MGPPQVLFAFGDVCGGLLRRVVFRIRGGDPRDYSGDAVFIRTAAVRDHARVASGATDELGALVFDCPFSGGFRIGIPTASVLVQVRLSERCCLFVGEPVSGE